MDKFFENIISYLKIVTLALTIILLFTFVFAYSGVLLEKKVKTEILNDDWQFTFIKNDQIIENLSISLPFDISNYINFQSGKVILTKKINLTNFNNPAIRLGKLSDGVEVYLDDLLIYEYGKKDNIVFSAYNFDKTIPLFKFDKNTNEYELKIVLYILTNVSINKPFILGEYEQLEFRSTWINFFDVIIKRFLFLIILVISIIFFYISLKEKRKDLLYFSLSSIFVLIFSSNQLFEYLPINYIKFNYFFVYKSMYLMAIFFFLSFFYLSKEKLNILAKIIIILFSIFFIIDLLFINNYSFRRKVYTYELFLGILSFIYLVFYVYYSYFHLKKKELKKYILPFTILFFTITNDLLVFIFPSSYPQFYTMIYGFEFYILIVSRIILNQLIQTYIETDKKNREINNSNEELKNYLDGISKSINLLQKNSKLFEETSHELIQKSFNTKDEIDILKEKVRDLTLLNNEIHKVDTKILELSESQITTGNELRNLIEQNSSNFNYMRENLNIAKEFSNQIEDISKQTVLLGLNASIESTKSAEFYKSFAVVAQEVKNLASKSNDLVYKIKLIADDIIVSTNSGIDSSKLLSDYFEEFYKNFQEFMVILNQNQIIHKGIEDNFNDISFSISRLSNIIDDLYNYAEVLRNQII